MCWMWDRQNIAWGLIIDMWQLSLLGFSSKDDQQAFNKKIRIETTGEGVPGAVPLADSLLIWQVVTGLLDIEERLSGVVTGVWSVITSRCALIKVASFLV